MRGSRTRRKRSKTKTVQYFDYSLMAVIIFLVCFGLIMLYSASAYSAQDKFGDGMYFLKRQGLFSAVSIGVMWVVSKIDYHIYARYAKALYFLSLFLMALVKTPLGKEVYGARRWLKLPFGQTLQPSEITKVAIILFIPLLICMVGKKIKTVEGTWKILIWGGIAALGVFVLTENLSTAVIVMGITCILVFVSHPKPWKYVAVIVGIIAVGVIVILILNASIDTSDNFRLRRLLVWLRPEEFSATGGFQTLQGLYAIGSGGFFGKGLGNSVQKMRIPEVQNDMILSVICEELGVFGAIMIMLLFGLLLYRLLFVAQNAPDMYGSLVVTGIFAHIAIQVVLNICVVLNVIPTTGITLPFISYGGTSVLFLMIEMGIALGVSRRIKFEE